MIEWTLANLLVATAKIIFFLSISAFIIKLFIDGNSSEEIEDNI